MSWEFTVLNYLCTSLFIWKCNYELNINFMLQQQHDAIILFRKLLHVYWLLPFFLPFMDIFTNKQTHTWNIFVLYLFKIYCHIKAHLYIHFLWSRNGKYEDVNEYSKQPWLQHKPTCIQSKLHYGKITVFWKSPDSIKFYLLLFICFLK